MSLESKEYCIDMSGPGFFIFSSDSPCTHFTIIMSLPQNFPRLPVAASAKIIGQLQKGYGGNLGKGVSDRKESGGYRRPGGITKGGTDDAREIWGSVFMKVQGIQAIGGESGQRHKKKGLDIF